MVEAAAQPGGTAPVRAVPLDRSAVTAAADTLPGAVVGVGLESRVGQRCADLERVPGPPDGDVALPAVALA